MLQRTLVHHSCWTCDPKITLSWSVFYFSTSVAGGPGEKTIMLLLLSEYGRVLGGFGGNWSCRPFGRAGLSD